MGEALPPDEREHTRVRVSVYVEVEAEGARRAGYLQDLSLGGFFLPCRPPLAVGARCRCSIFIAGPSADAVVAVAGRVARNSVLGCAIVLDAIEDRRSREQLQRLLLAYSDDPAALEREFRRDEARRTGSD
ncbi:MAG: PilZ domain-containing protein [Planctomycetota bacterium]|nr:MAG: PilZ domain-containing protein [Planctomycetota bacterium]